MHFAGEALPASGRAAALDRREPPAPASIAAAQLAGARQAIDSQQYIDGAEQNRGSAVECP
jgi:hypothetical protein